MHVSMFLYRFNSLLPSYIRHGVPNMCALHCRLSILLTYLRSRTSDAVLFLGVEMTDHECRECISLYADSKTDTAI